MNKITEEYKNRINFFDEFKVKIELLIKELLIDNDIRYHKLESRTKLAEKLDEKIKKKNDKYNILSDVTDLVGVRIITFFEDEVDKVASIIEKEFIKDETNTIDKRLKDADRFGYQSLHYIVELSNERKKLTEYRRFKEIKFEIQIRSILQHAWAEIEHDIGYKGEITIPLHLKRNFSRVSALLETADIEFVKIRKEVLNYEEKVSKEIIINPANVDINLNSLNSYISNNSLVARLDNEVTKQTNYSLEEKNNLTEYLLKGLKYIGITTIETVNLQLEKNKNLIISFVQKWIKASDTGIFVRGISIFYLLYVLIGEKKNYDIAFDYVVTCLTQGNKGTEAQHLANKIISTYEMIE